MLKDKQEWVNKAWVEISGLCILVQQAGDGHAFVDISSL